MLKHPGPIFKDSKCVCTGNLLVIAEFLSAIIGD